MLCYIVEANILSDLYNAFLAPGSPCELNIDHGLRNALVGRMTRFELPDTELLTTANDIVQLYDQAQQSVFKLMASVCLQRSFQLCRALIYQSRTPYPNSFASQNTPKHFASIKSTLR